MPDTYDVPNTRKPLVAQRHRPYVSREPVSWRPLGMPVPMDYVQLIGDQLCTDCGCRHVDRVCACGRDDHAVLDRVSRRIAAFAEDRMVRACLGVDMGAEREACVRSNARDAVTAFSLLGLQVRTTDADLRVRFPSRGGPCPDCGSRVPPSDDECACGYTVPVYAVVGYLGVGEMLSITHGPGGATLVRATSSGCPIGQVVAFA